MNKKTLSAQNKITVGINDVESSEETIKFICEFKNGYVFVLPKHDINGEPVYKTDAKGNNKVPVTEEYRFTIVSGHKNADGKVDPTTAFSYFTVSKEEHGDNFDRIVAKLSMDCKNPRNKMYREDDHFKKRNPEAYRIAKDKADMEQKLVDITNEKDARIAELEKQLFGKKKG